MSCILDIGPLVQSCGVLCDHSFPLQTTTGLQVNIHVVRRRQLESFCKRLQRGAFRGVDVDGMRRRWGSPHVALNSTIASLITATISIIAVFVIADQINDVDCGSSGD